MTIDIPAPAEALSREQLLTLLIEANEAARQPSELNEALAEHFASVMIAPGTADLLRSILAALARAEAAEAEVKRLQEALDRVKAHTRLFKEDSRSLLRLRMQAVYEEATTALCQHGSVLRTSDGIHACLECGDALAGSPS